MYEVILNLEDYQKKKIKFLSRFKKVKGKTYKTKIKTLQELINILEDLYILFRSTEEDVFFIEVNNNKIELTFIDLGMLA